jgi:hypothetical protein
VDQVSESQDTDWSERALRAEARLEEVLEERARLWQELHELRALRADEQYFQKLYRALESSVSWKVTRPLRSAKVLAAKVQRVRNRRRS